MQKILDHPMTRYVAPFAVFMILTECQRFGGPESVFWIYAAKVILTTLTFFILFKPHMKEIEGKFDPLAIGVGLLVLILWIGPSFFQGAPEVGSFNPEVFSSTFLMMLAIGFRIAGAVLIVPIIEEIFARSFVMRYLVKSDFTNVKLGTYTHASFWITVIVFTSVHRMWEWPQAIATGVLYGGYLVKTKNLKGCILAHAVTNLGLAIYVLMTKQWGWW